MLNSKSNFMKRKILLIATLAITSQLFVNAQSKTYRYSFNKDFKDSISGANEGVVTGDVTLLWDDTRKSTVAVFNEVDPESKGYVTLPSDILNIQAITVSCWAMHNNQSKVGNWGRFWDFGCNDANYIMLSYSQDASMKPTVDTKVAGAAGPRTQSPLEIHTGEWNHYVVTHGDGFTRLYMNGVEVNSVENTQVLTDIFGAGEGTNYLGKSHYNDDPLVGRIDDMIILDRVLSAEEVANLFEDKLELGVEKTDALSAKVYAANGSIEVNLDAPVAGSIEVYDVTGKSVYQTSSVSATNSIAVPAAGLYLVKLTQGAKVSTTKVQVAN